MYRSSNGIRRQAKSETCEEAQDDDGRDGNQQKEILAAKLAKTRATENRPRASKPEQGAKSGKKTAKTR
jgi:hypothetical protein